MKGKVSKTPDYKVIMSSQTALVRGLRGNRANRIYILSQSLYLWRQRQVERQRRREFYYEELAHMIREADMSQDLQSASGGPRKADRFSSSPSRNA